jgi:RNA-directed DNA polymerase
MVATSCLVAPPIVVPSSPIKLDCCSLRGFFGPNPALVNRAPEPGLGPSGADPGGPETIYFLDLTLYCTRNRKGNFKVGMRTEKTRLRRSLMSLQELTRTVRHHPIGEQVGAINAVLRGHYAYYGIAGNIRALFKVYRAVECCWSKMLRSRSRAASRMTWDAFNQIKQRTPLQRPKLRLPYRELQAHAVL